MFQFGRFPSIRYGFTYGCTNFFVRIAPFGDLRIKACLQLPAAYRSLPRPSSAPNAKASTMRSSALYLLSLGIFASLSTFVVLPDIFWITNLFSQVSLSCRVSPLRQIAFEGTYTKVVSLCFLLFILLSSCNSALLQEQISADSAVVLLKGFGNCPFGLSAHIHSWQGD